MKDQNQTEWLKRPVYYQWLTLERSVKVKEYVKEELDRAEVLGVGTYQYCFQVGGRVIYDSQLARRTEGLDGDLLREFVEQAHKRGLKFVVGWLATSPGCGVEIMEHPDWAQRASDGGFPFEHQTVVCYNTPYRDFLFSQVREILKNYEVDAIYFDQVPMGCFCKYCRDLYEDMYQEPFPTLTREQAYTNGPALYPIPGDSKRLGVSRAICRKLHVFSTERRIAWANSIRQAIEEVRPGTMLVLNRAELIDAGPVRDLVDAFMPESGLPCSVRPSNTVNKSLERHLTGVYGGRKPVWEVVKYDKFGVRAGSVDRMKSLLTEALSNDHIPVFRDQDAIALSLPALQEEVFKTTRQMEAVRQSKAGLDRCSYAALLHSKSSYHFSRELTEASFYGIAEFMSQRHIPFNIVSEEDVQAGNIRAGLLIIPNSVCLEKTTLEAVQLFCAEGGNLVVTGRSGELDENERPYEHDIIAELCGVQRIAWNANKDWGALTPRLKEVPIPARHWANYRFVRVSRDDHPAVVGQEGALTDFNLGHSECRNVNGNVLAQICTFDQRYVNVPHYDRRIPFPGEERWPLLVVREDGSKRAYFAAPVGSTEVRNSAEGLQQLMEQALRWCGGIAVLEHSDLPPSIKMTFWGSPEQKRMVVLLHSTELLDCKALGYNNGVLKLNSDAEVISCKSLTGGKVEFTDNSVSRKITVAEIKPYEVFEIVFT